MDAVHQDIDYRLDSPADFVDLANISVSGYPLPPAPTSLVVVAGTCPACNGEFRREHALSSVVGGSSKALVHDAGDPLFDHQVPVCCDCGNVHPNAPAGVTGCGRYSNIEV